MFGEFGKTPALEPVFLLNNYGLAWLKIKFEKNDRSQLLTGGQASKC